MGGGFASQATQSWNLTRRSAVPLNPQPLPPGEAMRVSGLDKRTLWPRAHPEPLPQSPPEGFAKSKRDALNPQPLPPGAHAGGGGHEVAERDAGAIQL